MRPTDECHPNENVYPYLARSRRLDRLAAGGQQTRLWAPSAARELLRDQGHRRVHVLRKSLRRVFLVPVWRRNGALESVLPERHETTEPLTLLSCAAFLRRAVLRPHMNTRATHRDRLVRSPRDRRTIRDDPECLPPAGTLRSDRPVSFDGGTDHQDPRGTLSRLRESPDDALAPPWAFNRLACAVLATRTGSRSSLHEALEKIGEPNLPRVPLGPRSPAPIPLFGGQHAGLKRPDVA